MGRSSETIEVKAAKKAHQCDWCPEVIEKGRPYKHYRYYGDDGVSTVKMHPECYAAMQVPDPKDPWRNDEWFPHSYARGCRCDAGECVCKKDGAV